MLINFGAIQSKSVNATIMLHFGSQDKGLSIYYVSSYNKAGSVGMLTNAYLREQGFIQKLMSYENPH